MRVSKGFWVPFAAWTMLMGGNAWGQTVGPPQRLIVKWAAAAASVPSGQVGSVARAMSDAQATYGVTMQPMRTLATGGQVMQLAPQMQQADMQNMLARLAQDPAVEYVHQDVLIRAAQTSCADCVYFEPNDPLYSAQFHLVDSTGVSKYKEAWAKKSGQGVRVAVVDSGVTMHPDLAANLLPGYDFISDAFIANDGDGRDASPLDPGDFTAAGDCGPGQPATNSTWHGTHVAGLIAAVSGNSVGVAGVARNAKVLPVRAIGRCGGLLSDVAEAAIWAAGGTIPGVPDNPTPAQIINLSLAAPARCDPTSQQVINIIRALGAAVIVSAGNDGTNIANTIPASCAGVIVVGASDVSGAKAPYSNDGYNVRAFGGTASFGVLSTGNAGATTPEQDSYEYRFGTSMATAIVSGTVALMTEGRPGRSPDTIKTAVGFSATNDCGNLMGSNFIICVTGNLDPTIAASILPEDPTKPVVSPFPLDDIPLY